MSGLSHKSSWVVGLVASLAIVVVAAVQAAIPDPSGAIHACYRSNGNLRLVDKSSCTSSETALTWNQTGPQGPAGAPGPQAPGPQGQPGTRSRRCCGLRNHKHARNSSPQRQHRSDCDLSYWEARNRWGLCRSECP